MKLKDDIEYIATEDTGFVNKQSGDDVVEFSSWFRRFVKRFGIGQKISRRYWGNNKRKQVQKLLYNVVKKDVTDGRPVQKKSKIQLYRDLRTDIKSKSHTDTDFKRIARTETTDLKVIFQLISWKKAGIVKVQHKTSPISMAKGTSGKRDIAYNNRIFTIEYLLSKAGDKDRIALHPNCMCRYVPVFE